MLLEGKLKALLDALVLAPKPNPPAEAPKAGAAPNAGVLEAPKAGVLVAPNAGVLLAEKAGVFAPKAGVLDPKAGVLVPKAGLVVPKLKEPPLAAPKAGVDPNMWRDAEQTKMRQKSHTADASEPSRPSMVCPYYQCNNEGSSTYYWCL